jgi:hypothetical protein
MVAVSPAVTVVLDGFDETVGAVPVLLIVMVKLLVSSVSLYVSVARTVIVYAPTVASVPLTMPVLVSRLRPELVRLPDCTAYVREKPPEK